VFETAYSLGLVLPDGYGLHWVDGTKTIHSLDETGKLAYYTAVLFFYYLIVSCDSFFSSHGPLSVCLCLCLSQVGVLSKRLNESGCFFAWELLSTCVVRKFRYLQ